MSEVAKDYSLLNTPWHARRARKPRLVLAWLARINARFHDDAPVHDVLAPPGAIMERLTHATEQRLRRAEATMAQATALLVQTRDRLCPEVQVEHDALTSAGWSHVEP